MIEAKRAVEAYHPPSLTKLGFVDDRLLDLEKNLLNMFGFGVAIGVQVCHSLETLLHEPVLRKPSRCLRQKKRHDNQEEGKEYLDDEWTLP